MVDAQQGDNSVPNRDDDNDDDIVGAAVIGPDGKAIPLSKEEAQKVKDAADQAEQDRINLVQELVEQLIEKREHVVRARRDIDKRWVDDQRQWDGESRLPNTKEFPSMTNDDNMKPPRPHLTRARCDLWESRMIDLIAPTTEATWDLNPLTVEDIEPPSGIDPSVWEQCLRVVKEDAEARALKMKNVVMDQLAACNAVRAKRKMCKDACRMGTGLLMGPMNGVHVRRRYNPPPGSTALPHGPPLGAPATPQTPAPQPQAAPAGAQQPPGQPGTAPAAPPPAPTMSALTPNNQPPGPPQTVKPWQNVSVTIEESIVPEIREADPWCFFPDMTSSADKAQFAFYLHWMGEVDLWNFAEFPGVNRDEIIEVIDEKPEYGEIETTMRERNTHSGLREDIADRHAVWRYTGIVDRKYLLALDMEADQGLVCADIWFCNRHILKSKITMLSAVKDYRIPYYVFSPFPIDDTMFGASIAYLCRDSQRIADASLLVGLHNLSVTAGPQFIMRRGKLTPADGKYSIRGPKVWYANSDDETPLDDIFATVQLTNNAEQAFEAFQLAETLMDAELNTQQWASPDTSQPAQSGIGWAMMSNARTILQRRVCATSDDDVDSPMIERMVLWNLLYNERDDIKGDFDVQPLCQSVRMVKDIQNQQKLFIANNVAQSPMFQSIFSPYDMVADIIRGLDVQVENWLKPKDQWTQEQAQQAQQASQSPQAQIAAAQLHLTQQRSQTEGMKQAKMASEAQQPQAETPAAPLTDPNELAKHSMDKQVELQNMNTQLAMTQTKTQSDQTVAAMNLQAKREGIAADLRKAHVSETNKLLKTGLDAKVKIETAKTKFPVGQAAPSHSGAAFKAPATPKIRK